MSVENPRPLSGPDGFSSILRNASFVVLVLAPALGMVATRQEQQ